MSTLSDSVKRKYYHKSTAQKLLFWCEIYLVLVLLVAMVFTFVIPAFKSATGSSKQSAFTSNLERAYDRGTFNDIECQSSAHPARLSGKYGPEVTRRLLKESGFLDGTAQMVGISASRDYSASRYEPEHATRPSFILSRDKLQPSNTSRICVLDIIQ